MSHVSHLHQSLTTLLSESGLAFTTSLLGSENWTRYHHLLTLRSQDVTGSDVQTVFSWLLDLGEEEIRNSGKQDDVDVAVKHEATEDGLCGVGADVTCDEVVRADERQDATNNVNGYDADEIEFVNDDDIDEFNYHGSSGDFEVVYEDEGADQVGGGAGGLDARMSCHGMNSYAPVVTGGSRKKPARRYACQWCARTCSSRRALRDHTLNKHETSEPTYACPYCGKRFRYSCNLHTHTKRKCELAIAATNQRAAGISSDQSESSCRGQLPIRGQLYMNTIS